MTDVEAGALLSAASVLLGVATFIYGAAYPGLARAAALRLHGRQLEDARDEREQARLATRRAMWLALACTGFGVVFTPASYVLVRHFVDRLPSVEAFEDYNALGTALVVANAVYFGLACHAFAIALRAREAARSLSGR
jgi:hypothetical protein